MNDELRTAASLLMKKCNVVPEKYTIYNGAYLFVAFPKGMSNAEKSKCMSIHYLVDLKHKAAGPFSPAFDLDGFFKAAENFKDLLYVR